MIFYRLVFFFNLNFLFGHRFFFISCYFVAFPILLPRSESGVFFCIVRNFFDFENLVVLEVGCGSGILSCLFFNFVNLSILSLDIKNYAIFLFYKNYFFLKNKDFYVVQCDWYFLLLSFKNFNLFVCNPPYLSFSDFKFFFDEFSFECKDALVSGCSGLSGLFLLVNKTFDSIDKNSFVILEHGYCQAKDIRQAMMIAGFVNVYTYNDMLGINRITVGEK